MCNYCNEATDGIVVHALISNQLRKSTQYVVTS